VTLIAKVALAAPAMTCRRFSDFDLATRSSLNSGGAGPLLTTAARTLSAYAKSVKNLDNLLPTAPKVSSDLTIPLAARRLRYGRRL
jgi:hypothetical protein